ncbi:hypothetical protein YASMINEVIRUS_181 [Yasminevirus sp. GU-2018]|uniref:C2H2-type domain-containing protein n=1 Tax=Yasminevirus sp. GU-2018 TaxID=2420051 RepID=A0A5K0U731_9VIRU|nr:hypothetical protein YASMINEVIRUS_181 [Yasminevirus sp. GU-2018]
MPDYICDKCDREFTQKSNLDYHINNNACKSFSHFCKWCRKGFTTPSSMYRHMRLNCAVKKEEDGKKTEIFEQLVSKEKRNNKLAKLVVNNDNESDGNSDECSEDDNKVSVSRQNKLEKENELLKKELESIKKKFKHFEKIEEEVKDLKKIKKEVKDLKQVVATTKSITKVNNKTVNNNNGVIINGNVTLIGYGQEDLTKLKKTELLKILQQGYHSTIKLTEAVHFNPKYPEYHNVYISNIKDKYAMMFDGKNWTLTTKEELINKIYDDKKNYIEENLEEFMDSLSASRKKALERWLETDDNDNKIKEIKDSIKLLLYNQRKMVDVANVKQPITKIKSTKTTKAIKDDVTNDE